MNMFIRWLPDSPRWLMRHGKLDETKAILLKGASKNKRQIPSDIDRLLLQQAECMWLIVNIHSFHNEIDVVQFFCRRHEPPPATWLSIWDGQPKKRYLLACHYAWSAYILLYNSVVLNIRAYGRDHLQINTVAIGMVESLCKYFPITNEKHTKTWTIFIRSAFSEIIGVYIGMYLVLYTRRRWLWSGLMSIACGCLAYSAWLIPHTC